MSIEYGNLKMIPENENNDSSPTSASEPSEATSEATRLGGMEEAPSTTNAIENVSAFTVPVIHPTVDRPRIERAVREILAAVGEDPDREGLLETPKRVAKMYEELLHGLQEDPRIHLRKFFTEQYDEIVLVRDISFSSMCEHHLLPFFGKAHIAYLPKGRIIGLSKLARLVDSVARRPQVQERMTEQIANLLTQELDVLGVAVIIEAEHTCMTIRGIRRPGSRCVTSAMRGRFRSDARSRAEVMALIYSGQTPVK